MNDDDGVEYYSFVEFTAAIINGCLNPDDGTGYWVTPTGNGLSVWDNPKPDDAINIAWYSK